MQKVIDAILGTMIVTATVYTTVASRKAIKAFLNTFNNLVFVECVNPSRIVLDAEDYFVSGTTGYIVKGSRFAVEGVCRYGFNAVSLSLCGDEWLIARAKGLRIVDENGESINKTGKAQLLSSLLGC